MNGEVPEAAKAVECLLPYPNEVAKGVVGELAPPTKQTITLTGNDNTGVQAGGTNITVTTGGLKVTCPSAALGSRRRDAKLARRRAGLQSHFIHLRTRN